MLLPNTSEGDEQNAKPTGTRSFTQQNIPETPFTKTLNYYKQIAGSENTSTKRRRTTALPQEIAEVAEAAHSMTEHAGAIDKALPHSPSSIVDANDLPSTSALDDLMEMAVPEVNKDVMILSRKVLPEEVSHQVDALGTVSEEINSMQAEPGTPSSDEDAQKQLILYPQHPAIITAIGMIPATMFWATAAPIVKYGNMAVELMIDKLRETYL